MPWSLRESTATPVRRSWQGGGFDSPAPKPSESKPEKSTEAKKSDGPIHTTDIHFDRYKGAYAGIVRLVGGKPKIDQFMKREKYGASGSVIHVEHKHGDIIQASSKSSDNMSPDYYVSVNSELKRLGRKTEIYRVIKSYFQSGDNDPEALVRVVAENY
jgi:hypothetical protein